MAMQSRRRYSHSGAGLRQILQDNNRDDGRMRIQLALDLTLLRPGLSFYTKKYLCANKIEAPSVGAQVDEVFARTKQA